MELVLNQELEFVPELIEVPRFTTQGLLNSNYKSLVKKNFSETSTKSLFGIRRRLRSSQLNVVNHTATILRISIFATILVAIF